MAEIMAATIEGDFRSRLRHAPRGGSERFHAIKEGGGFACGYELPPGSPVPAQTVGEGLRCRRNGCRQLFATAGVPAAPAQTFPHEPPMKDSP